MTDRLHLIMSTIYYTCEYLDTIDYSGMFV